MGIKQDNIAEILEACKSDKNVYFPEAYEKISELHHRGIDDNGVKQFLKESYKNREFSPEKYATLVRQSAKIKTLRDHAHTDEYIIDSFEANGKLHSDPLVTDNLIAFAKQVCAAMGRSDAQVMIGPNYNNIDKSRLFSTSAGKIKVLGSTSAKTYCDSVGGHADKDKIINGVEERTMYIYR